MAESSDISEPPYGSKNKKRLEQQFRECEDNTYSRDDRQACYRWAEEKPSKSAQLREVSRQQGPESPFLVDLHTLNTHNEKGCEVCNRKFSLGDTVVMARGPWPGDRMKLIHEQEAVFDDNTRTWYERTYFMKRQAQA